MRKPRPDAKIFGQLTPHQQGQVAEWLMKESYEKVKERIWMDYGVRVNVASLAAFWQQCCSARLTEQLARAARTADEYAAALKNADPRWDDAIGGMIRQKIFEMGAKDKLTDKQMLGMLMTYTELRKVGVKEGALILQNQKLQLDIEKHEEQKAKLRAALGKVKAEAQARKSGGISAEALAEIEQAAGLL